MARILPDVPIVRRAGLPVCLLTLDCDFINCMITVLTATGIETVNGHKKGWWGQR